MKHCPECDAVMLREELNNHMAMHRLEPVVCSVCHLEMPKRSLGGHMVRHNGTNAMLNKETHRAAMLKRSANSEYREYLSKRMTENNPTSNPETVKKMTTSINRLITQGVMVPFGNSRQFGNGGKPTPAESRILSLCPDAIFNLSVATKDKQRPYHYKIDLAWPDSKVGLEIDGSSHATRKTADERKTLRLSRLGWTIHRMTNELALSERAESFLLQHGLIVDTCTTSK
jgi:very-short-patch-repair endonuclease